MRKMALAALSLAVVTLVAGNAEAGRRARATNCAASGGCAAHTTVATTVATTHAAPEAKEKKADIVDTAVGAGSFKTLVAAVKAAGLVETLKSPGPFTVFAPTDEAFAKLPPGTVEALLKDKAKLTAILTYHVVPGSVKAADVVKLKEAKTVQGGSVMIEVADGGVKIDGAKVLKTDIECANGVIHVIDTVILPK